MHTTQLSFILFILITITLHAHDGDSSSNILNENSVKSSEHETGLEGAIELRPTYQQASSEFYTENSAELNYHFNPSILLGYTQEFGTNLYKAAGTNEGLGFALGMGFFRTSFENIFKNVSETTALDYEARVYVPTDSNEWQAGHLTRLQNTVSLHHIFSDSIHLFFSETPIWHAYSKSGNLANDTMTANKRFENRLTVAGEFFLFNNSLKIKLPLTLQHIRYADYDMSAQSNNGWGRGLWLNPEITYPLTASTTVGVAYAKDLLGDLSQSNLSTDVGTDNIFQFILQQAL